MRLNQILTFEPITFKFIITGRNEVLAKVIFSQACVILFTGGVSSRGGVSKFLGWGVLQIFRGSPIFFWGGRVGDVVSNFSGGSPIFREGVLQLEYGQCSAGTHPTGMHSCILKVLFLTFPRLNVTGPPGALLFDVKPEIA